MGVPRADDGRIIWIMLEPMHGPRYKQMPEGNFTIERALWWDLWSQQRMSETVAEALRGHLPLEESMGGP